MNPVGPSHDSDRSGCHRILSSSSDCAHVASLQMPSMTSQSSGGPASTRWCALYSALCRLLSLIWDREEYSPGQLLPSHMTVAALLLLLIWRQLPSQADNIYEVSIKRQRDLSPDA